MPGVCPNGYKREIGDIPEWGHPDLGVKLFVQSQWECAEKCNKLPRCLSFEHSSTENFCNLNDVAMPTDEAFRDYVFCRKSGLNTLLIYSRGSADLKIEPTSSCEGGQDKNHYNYTPQSIRSNMFSAICSKPEIENSVPAERDGYQETLIVHVECTKRHRILGSEDIITCSSTGEWKPQIQCTKIGKLSDIINMDERCP